MIAVAVIVRDKLGDGTPKVMLPDWKDPIEALVFDRAHEALGVGIRIRRACGDQHDTHVGDEACHVQPSVVKKSAPAMTRQWAFRNICHELGRRGTGGRPWAFKILTIVDRPTRCPGFLSAPWIRV